MLSLLSAGLMLSVALKRQQSSQWDSAPGHQLLLQKGLGLLQVLLSHVAALWMNEIHKGISNDTKCLCMGAASYSCPFSVVVSVWMLGPRVDLDVQTSMYI